MGFHARPAVVQHGQQQALARSELMLDDAPRDPGPPGDLVRARLVVAELQDALGGRIEDALGRELAVGAAPSATVSVVSLGSSIVAERTDRTCPTT